MSQQARVFSSLHLPQAEVIQHILTLEGIPAEIRNVGTVKLAGEVPFDQCYIEVWVDSERLEKATGVLANARSTDEESEENCPACGSLLSSNFAVCWSCGRLQGDLDPTTTQSPSKQHTRAVGAWTGLVGRYFVWGLLLLLLVAAVAWVLDRSVRGDPAFRERPEADAQPSRF